MKRFSGSWLAKLFVICVGLGLCAALVYEIEAQRTRRVHRRPPVREVVPTPSLTPARVAPLRTVRAADFAGRDVGARINAADRALGSAAGVIEVVDGGTLTTPVIISENHTLRLRAGIYQPVTAEIPILLKAGASVVGDGWDKTILTESTANGQFIVIGGYGGAQLNGNPDYNLTIRDLQIKGANAGFNSAPQAIGLGNCVNCVVERVWVNSTRAIGIQLGGAGRYGYKAENSRVTDCLFTRVASQNLAVVNGRNILLARNKFYAPGQKGGPGSTNIDLETNDETDFLENITIRDNLIDVRDSEIPTSGNGILIQSASPPPRVGNILVENNILIGGSNTGTITNIMSNGIYVFGPTMQTVTIRNNRVTRTGQAGLNLQGTKLTVVNNTLTDVGGGGTPGFILDGVTDSVITGNTFTYTGAGPVDDRIVIVSGKDNARNTLRDNRGWRIGF